MIHLTTQRFSALLQPKALATVRTQWPDPELSIGVWYRSMGRYNCWEAKGPARESFVQLAEEVKRHLAKHGDSLLHTVIWSVYMIGRKKDSAAPTLMFCCKCADSRRKVRKCIEESGILRSYPGFNVGDCSQPPDFNQLVQLAAGEDSDDDLCRECEENLVNDVDVLCAPSANSNKMSVFVKQRQEPDSAWSQKATASGTFRLGGRYFYLTVAHAFRKEYDWWQSGWEESNGSDEFEFDIGGMEDDISSSDDDDLSDIKSVPLDIGIIPSQTTVDLETLQRSQLINSPEQNVDELLQNGVKGELVLTSANGPCPSLDYALINIPQPPIVTFHSDLLRATFPSAKSRTVKNLRDGKIICFTSSSGRLTGEISGTPSYANLLCVNGKRIQEVWTVRLDGKLTSGDCGSWILDPEDGNMWGQIIAGSPNTGVAFIIPASHIFEDIERRLGGVLEVCRISLKGEQADMPTPSTQVKEEMPQETTSTLGRSISITDNKSNRDQWAKDLTQRFRELLSQRRMSTLKSLRYQLSRSRPEEEPPGYPSGEEPPGYPSGEEPPGYPSGEEPAGYPSEEEPSGDATSTDRLSARSWSGPRAIRNIPILPAPSSDPVSLRFHNELRVLSEIPMRWENPGLLDEALGVVPLQQIYEQAEEESQLFQATAASMDKLAAWGWQDCAARALLKWFKRSFFRWVNNPHCTACGKRSITAGHSVPTPEERALGASRVELYNCSSCNGTERFPRYNDAFVLLQTRRGRSGEWVNCFGMLARALGCRVRWVWTSEDRVWLEIFSDHRERWVHVDPCEELWDKPLTYTEGWKGKARYCLAFSVDGATDVTRRYLRNPARYGLERNRVSEPVLLHILESISTTRRQAYSKEHKFRLEGEDIRERSKLRHYVISSLVSELCNLQFSFKPSSEKQQLVQSLRQSTTSGTTRSRQENGAR